MLLKALVKLKYCIKNCQKLYKKELKLDLCPVSAHSEKLRKTNWLQSWNL